MDAASQSGTLVCLVHMLGEPRTMQQNPDYGDVVSEVYDFLLDRVRACESAGISRSRLVLDIGFGFGKSAQDNLTLVNRLPIFLKLELCGIWKSYNCSTCDAVAVLVLRVM